MNQSKQYSDIAQQLPLVKLVSDRENLYISLGEVKLYEEECKKIQNSLTEFNIQNPYLYSGKYVWENGKEYIQSKSEQNLRQTHNKFRKITPKNYLIDIPINNITCTHKISIQVITTPGTGFYLYSVDRQGKKNQKFKFTVQHCNYTVRLRVWVPIHSIQKIWKQLQLPMIKLDDKVCFSFEQGYQTDPILNINRYQFKLPLSPMKNQQSYYAIYLPNGINLWKVQLFRAPIKKFQAIQSYKCQNNCIIY